MSSISRQTASIPPARQTWPRDSRPPHQTAATSPPAPRPQPLRRHSGTLTGKGCPAAAASQPPGTLARLGVSLAQQSCPGAPASRPVAHHNQGWGCSAGCDGPLAHPCAPTGRARRGHSDSPDCRGSREQAPAVTSARPSRPSCVLPSAQRPTCAGDGTPEGLQPAFWQEASASLLPKPQRNQEVGGGRPTGLSGHSRAPSHQRPACLGPGSAPQVRPHAMPSQPWYGSRDPGPSCPPPAHLP